MRRVRNRRNGTARTRVDEARPRNKSRTPVSPERAVLGVLRQAGRPLRLDEVVAALGPSGAAQAEQQLQELVRRGEVVLNRRGHYCLREQLPGLTVGTVQAH